MSLPTRSPSESVQVTGTSKLTPTATVVPIVIAPSLKVSVPAIASICTAWKAVFEVISKSNPSGRPAICQPPASRGRDENAGSRDLGRGQLYASGIVDVDLRNQHDGVVGVAEERAVAVGRIRGSSARTLDDRDRADDEVGPVGATAAVTATSWRYALPE